MGRGFLFGVRVWVILINFIVIDIYTLSVNGFKDNHCLI